MRSIFVAIVLAIVIGAVFTAPSLSHERVLTTVTFNREVVRILNKKCIACHSADNMSVPMTSYEQTRPWARAIEEEVLTRRMPPWRAVAGYGEFANDVALTNRELQLMVSWIEGNGPKTREERLIVNFDQGETDIRDRLNPDFSRWQLGSPDLTAALAPEQVAAGGSQVRRVVVSTGVSGERWLRALEFKPEDRRVMRAVFFSVEGSGQWLGSWTPWYGVTTFPADTAVRLAPGARIIAEVHYKGGSEPIMAGGSLGLYFAGGAPARSVEDLVVNASPLPGGEGRPKFQGTATLPADIVALALKPDVQAGVEAFEVSATKPDGTVQVLLLVRDALPEFPTPYINANPVHLPAGTQLRVTYYYKASAVADQPMPSALKLTISATSSSPLSTAR